MNNEILDSSRCGMIFRRMSDLDDLAKAQTEEQKILNPCEPGTFLSSHGTDSRKRKRQGGNSEDESDLALFRRVRIRASSHFAAEEPRAERRRTKQTATKSTGGMVPNKHQVSWAARRSPPSATRATRATRATTKGASKRSGSKSRA